MKIRVAVIGVGNCTSSFVQGRFYYEQLLPQTTGLIPGIMHPEIGGYRVTDIIPVVAFDIDHRKVGKDLSEAIWSEPNCTAKFADVPNLGVEVLMGPVLDGVTEHLKTYVQISDKDPIDDVDTVARIFTEQNVDVMVINLPTASEQATKFYCEAALRAGVGIVNGTPVLIANDPSWVKRLEEAQIPIIGDDYKSQLGGTILDRSLLALCQQRGIKIDKSYQLNYGGNTDFWNLTDWSRGKTKHASKKKGVDAVMKYDAPFSVNVSHLEVLDDEKICRIEIWGQNFGGTPIFIEAKLHVVDAPNSAGVMVDMIRCCKVAMNRGICGILESAASYLCKSGPVQYPSDEEAREMLDAFIEGRIER